MKWRAGLGLVAALSLGAGGQGMSAGGTRPAVSLDGRRVAFNSARDGTWDVFVIGADGHGERRVTFFAEKNFVALGPTAWIGERLFIWRRVDDTTRVILVDPSGSAGIDSIRAAVPFDATQVRPSPDGKSVVFLHGDRRRPRLATSRLDGTELRELTDGSARALNPAWSPDGARIAFTVVDSASRGQIAIVGRDGTGYRTLTHFDSNEGLPQWPAWAPDGKRLAIQAGKYNSAKVEESTAHLWIVDVESGDAVKLATHTTPMLDETPAWFPDGKRIAFQSNRSGRLEIWTMKPDGSDARQLTR